MIDPYYKVTIAGVDFDNRMVLAAGHLIEAFLLFNNLDNEFADQGNTEEDSSGVYFKKEGRFYGRAWYATADLLRVMGFDEKETDTILMEVTDQSEIRCSMERILLARRDDDTDGYRDPTDGPEDCEDFTEAVW